MIRCLGEKIRTLRLARELTQSELAERLGLSGKSKGYISEIESHKKLPSLVLVVQLADIFGVTTDYLLRDEINAFPPALSRPQDGSQPHLPQPSPLE